MSAMNRLLCNFFYYMFLAVAIRTAVGQAPAPAPTGPPKAPAPVPAKPHKAAAPASAGTLNITAILEKGGRFSKLIKLMTSTPIANQINGELKYPNDFMTIFAPTDAAFSALPSGTLNGLTDEEKTSLIQFHIIPTFIALSQFQTVTNPVSTHAGRIGKYGYPLNVTTSGNTVTLSTGVVTTNIAGTVYSDSQLVVYQLNKVLLPLDVFADKMLAQAPAVASTPKKKVSSAATARAPSVCLLLFLGLLLACFSFVDFVW